MPEGSAPPAVAPSAAGSSPAATPSNGAATPAAGSSAPASGAPTSAPAAPKAHRIRYGGQDVDIADADVPVFLSKGYAADQRFQEAAKLRKEAEDKERAWSEREIKLKSKEHLADVLREYGHDFDTLAAERIIARYNEQEAGKPKLPPEVERELTQLRAEKERLSKAEQERKAVEEKTKADEVRAAQSKEFADRFAAALDGLKIEPGAEIGRALIRRMAYHQGLALDGGWDLPAESLARLAKQDMATEASFVFGSLEGDALLDEMGDEWVNKVTRAAVARLQRRKGEGAVAAPPPPGTSPPPAKRGEPQRNANGQFTASTDRAFDRFMRIGGLDD